MAKVKWGWTFALILFLIFAALTVFAEQQATRIIKFAPTAHVRDVRDGQVLDRLHCSSKAGCMALHDRK